MDLHGILTVKGESVLEISGSKYSVDAVAKPYIKYLKTGGNVTYRQNPKTGAICWISMSKEQPATGKMADTLPPNQADYMKNAPKTDANTPGPDDIKGTAKPEWAVMPTVSIEVTVNLEHYENIRMTVTGSQADFPRLIRLLADNLRQFGEKDSFTKDRISMYIRRVLDNGVQT